MSIDIPVQCCRCKNKHMHFERESVYKPKNGWSSSVCPRCGAESFYNMEPLVAWCWASGRIEVGAETPLDSVDGSGAIQIASGPKSQLMLVLNMFAKRHPVYDYVVPGIESNATQREAGNALALWLSDCEKVAQRRKTMKEVLFNLPVHWDALVDVRGSGCGACGDGCAGRSGGCRLAEESPPITPENLPQSAAGTLGQPQT